MSMKKFTFGTPEEFVPSKFCDDFNYVETGVSYPESRFSCKRTKQGFIVEFPIEDDCQIFGFGLQLKTFAHRGRKLRMDVNADPATGNGESHAPVPFFVTNKGYGMYFDTARYAEFYCGKQRNGDSLTLAEGGAAGDINSLYAARTETSAIMSVRIPCADGIDIYVIEGGSITDIVSQYNMLSGGGPVVPEWGFGMLYRAYYKWDSEKVKSVADYLRSSDIPCDIIGLEPGWQTRAYSCSFKWSDRYPDPDGFIAYLRERGFHINLWQHAFTHPEARFHKEIAPYSGDWLVWGGLVPDFATPEGRKIFADYTRSYLVERGIDGFKLDECDSSDNTGGWSFPLISEFPSGLDGEQYHSLFGTLYIKTIMDALGDNITLSQVRNIGALAASYPFVLYSDLYDHRDFIRGVVNSGFSGIMWAPEFRSAHSKEECVRRMQTIVFSVQCLVNAWNYDGIPWVVHECEAEVRELLKLRETLKPRLMRAFKEYHETGRPPVRALVMDYTDDKETYAIDNEWLFCDDLLVAPIAAGTGDTREVYLPVVSDWVDFFTGEPVKSGRFKVETGGIPVYRRV